MVVYIEKHNFQLSFSKVCASRLQWTLPSLLGCDPDYVYTCPVETTFPMECSFNTHVSVVTAIILKQAWDEAYANWVVQSRWMVKQVGAYFKVLIINDATTIKFVDQGRRCQLALVF
jgi:hypothetical protein